MNWKRDEILTIPNLMSGFRIVLIPVIVWQFMEAGESENYLTTAVLAGISGITDMLDGFIARKFHMVSDLGKVLDPIADKLTQLALVLCLATRYSGMIPLVIFLAVKEGFMGIMGLLMLRHNGKKLDGAKWYGKVCTAVLYLVMFLLLLFPDLPVFLINIQIILCAVLMAFSLASYISVFYRMWRADGF